MTGGLLALPLTLPSPGKQGEGAKGTRPGNGQVTGSFPQASPHIRPREAFLPDPPDLLVTLTQAGTIAGMGPGLRACEEIVPSKRRHSGAVPTGPRCARPEDRLRPEPGTQEHLNFQYVRCPVFMGFALAGSARAPE
jgi:hypothetical protein